MSGGPGVQHRTVLVVEDSAVIAFELADEVAALGCTVLGPTGSVAEALHLIASGWPDVALLDPQLGLLTAVPIAEALRAVGVPYAVVTGHDQQDLAESVWQGVPYLAKPFSQRELHALVRELLLAEPG
jgi:DNA-binding response OmpR family regulator